MGLILSVYRTPGTDCTLGGVSSEHDRLTAVNLPGPFRPNDERPAVLVIQGPGGRSNPIVVPAEAVNTDDDPSGDGVEYIPASGTWSAGGNYAATSDSRFGEAVRALGGASGAISIHDRDMTKESGRAS